MVNSVKLPEGWELTWPIYEGLALLGHIEKKQVAFRPRFGGHQFDDTIIASKKLFQGTKFHPFPRARRSEKSTKSVSLDRWLYTSI